MYLKTTFEEVNAQFPEETGVVLENIRVEKPDIEPSDVEWQYQVYEKVDALGFEEMINEIQSEGEDEEENRSVEDRVEERVSNMEVFVSAVDGERKYTHSDSLHIVPQKVRNTVEEQVQREVEEEERIENLSEEERKQETEEALEEMGLKKDSVDKIMDSVFNRED